MVDVTTSAFPWRQAAGVNVLQGYNFSQISSHVQAVRVMFIIRYLYLNINYY